MSGSKIIPIIGLLCVFGAPFLAPNRSVSISKDIKTKTLINKEFTVKVNSINKSNSGFVTCTYYVNELSKVLLGSCKTTDNKELVVGRTYTVKNAVVDKEFIVINDASLIAGMVRRRVVKVYHKGWTKLAELDNGDVIGGDNVAVDEWVSNE